MAARLGEQVRLIPLPDIYYFAADQKYTTVRHKGGSDLIEDPLRALAEEFAARFVRVHRNALVNTQCIAAIERDAAGQYYVALRDLNERLAVSRRLAGELRDPARAPRTHVAARLGEQVRLIPLPDIYYFAADHQRRPERAGRIHRSARDSDAHQVDDVQSQADGQTGDRRMSLAARSAEDHQHENEGGNQLKKKRRLRAIAAAVTCAPAIVSQPGSGDVVSAQRTPRDDR